MIALIHIYSGRYYVTICERPNGRQFTKESGFETRDEAIAWATKYAAQCGVDIKISDVQL